MKIEANELVKGGQTAASGLLGINSGQQVERQTIATRDATLGPVYKRTLTVLFTTLAFVAMLALAFQARRPIIAFVFAILFAYLLEPVVTRFQTILGGSRGLGIAATYLVLGTLPILFFIAEGPRILKQTATLAGEMSGLTEDIGSGRIAQQIGSQRGWDYETRLRLQQFLRGHRDAVVRYIQVTGSRAAALAGALPWLLLIPVLAAFLLKSKSHLVEAFVELVDGIHDRGFLRAVLADLDVMLAAFIRAQLMLAALSMAAYTAFLLIAQFPYALAVGLFGGLLEFIPVVGFLVAAVVILGTATITGYPHFVVLVVFLLLWRGLQDYVNSPHLMGRGLELHPLAVIFGVLVFGEIAGIIGIFLSVPIIATLRILWKNWKRQTFAVKVESTAA